MMCAFRVKCAPPDGRGNELKIYSTSCMCAESFLGGSLHPPARILGPPSESRIRAAELGGPLRGGVGKSTSLKTRDKRVNESTPRDKSFGIVIFFHLGRMATHRTDSARCLWSF